MNGYYLGIGKQGAVSSAASRAAIAIWFSVIALQTSPVAAQQPIAFGQLPIEIKERVAAVRQACKELNPEIRFYQWQGIQFFDLEGDGSRDIIVDNEGLCGTHMAGANCTNRGCDLTIYKEVSSRTWRKILEEHAHSKLFVIEPYTNRFLQLTIQIYAGNTKCRPDPEKFYTSGMSCALNLRWIDGGWHWQLVEPNEPEVAKQSTRWNHNGSIMKLTVEGSRRQFFYDVPRQGVRDAGAEPGSLLFDGVAKGGRYSGTAYIFNRRCGQYPYEVSGPILDGDSRVVMRGKAPRVNRRCNVYGYKNDVLEFELLEGG